MNCRLISLPFVLLATFGVAQDERDDLRTSAPKNARVSSITPRTVSINGSPVPKGATHYYYSGENVRYLGGQIGATAWPTSPIFVDSVPSFSLPDSRFDSLPVGFSNQPGLAAHAFFTLYDQAIGPSSLESPIVDLPTISEALLTQATNDRFATVRALFENSGKPTEAQFQKNTAWAGRCVYRSAPNVESGALFAIAAGDASTSLNLHVMASPTDLDSGVEASATHYEQLAENCVAVARQQLEKHNLGPSRLMQGPKQDQPFALDSQFFDLRIRFANGLATTGFRARTFTSPTGKEVMLLEGYSPFRDGAAFAGKRVDFLEPIEYCHFSKAYYW